MVVTTRLASGSAWDHNLCGAAFPICSSTIRPPARADRAARAALPRGDRPAHRRQRQRSTTPSAPAIARSAANSPPLLPQAGRRGGRSPAQKPIFFALCRDEPSTVITRRVARGAGGDLCCDDGGRYRLLPVSAETSPRSLSTRIPESNTTRPGRYCFASLRDGALCLIGF